MTQEEYDVLLKRLHKLQEDPWLQSLSFADGVQEAINELRDLYPYYED